MPIFEIEGADGKIYEVEAPDQVSAAQAFAKFQPPTVSAKATPSVEGGYSGAPEWTKPITSFGNGIVDAVTFGFGDELGAGVSALGSRIFPWRDEATYDQELAKIRQDKKALAEQSPISNIAGQVTGGLAMASRLPGLMAPISSRMAASAPLASRMGAGLAEGFGAGALYGFGSGEGTQDRVTNALTTGAVGGAFGATVPAVTSAVSGGYRNIADRLARSKVARDAGVDPATANQVAAILAADDSLGPVGMANIQRAGPDAMAVDAGQNAKTLLDTLMARGGGGSTLARRRIDERLAKAGQDLATVLDDTLGAPQGILSAQRDIRGAARSGVRSAYEEAYSLPINYASEKGQAVEEVISRIPNRIKSSAIQKANERMIAEGRANQQLMANIADDGTVTFTEMPNVEQVDAIKKALDDIINDGTEFGGKMTSDAQLASKLKVQLRNALADAVPEYGAALRTAADPQSRQKAISIGYDILRPNTTRDQASIMLEGMTAPEKQAVAAGVRSYIDDAMANVKRTMASPDTDAREAAKAISDLSSRASKDKISAVLGEEQAAKLIDEIDRISTAFELQASVAKGSQTFTRTEFDRGLKERGAPGAFGLARQGKIGAAGQDVIQTLTGDTPEFRLAQENAITAEIADWLTRPASVALPQFRAMTDYSAQTAANAARSAEIARLLSMGQLGVYPATVAVTE